MCMYYNILTSPKPTQPHGAGGVGAVVGVCEPRVWCVTAPGARLAATRLYVYVMVSQRLGTLQSYNRRKNYMFYEVALTVQIFNFTSLPSLVYSVISGCFYLPTSVAFLPSVPHRHAMSLR